MANDIEQKDFDLPLPEIEIRVPESKLRLAEMKLRLSKKLIELENHNSSFADLTNQDFKIRLSEKKIELEKRNLSHAELLDFVAMLMLGEDASDIEIQAKDSHLDAQDLIIECLEICIEDQRRIIESVKELGELSDICRNTAEKLEPGMEKFQRKKKATKAADALHDLPGGSREKQKKIREIWASGKYTSRSICAEQECAALGMSYDAARKALRNTPAPT